MMEALSLERLNVLWSQGAMSKRTDCKCVWSLCASVCACNKDLPKKPWFQYAQSCNDGIIMINWGENRASSHTVDRSHFQICWETYQQLVFCFCLDPITTTLHCDFIYADRQVVASSDIQIADTGKTLRLLKAETADAGSYSCEAINVAGNAERSFFLDVLGE